MHLIARLIVGLALFTGLGTEAWAQPPVCTGKNILDELRITDPPAHARILAAAADTENANAIFWRVEKAGTAPSHLFGTMHMTDERIHRLSPAVKSALGAARRLVLEVDDVSPDAAAKQAAKAPNLVGLMTLADGRRLDQLLDATDYETLSQALSRIGVPDSAVGSFRPWLVHLMLALPACEPQPLSAGLPTLAA